MLHTNTRSRADQSHYKLTSSKMLFICLTLLLFGTTADARTWTCNATIALTDSSSRYTLPPWTMSRNFNVNIEKECRSSIKTNWLNNRKIWTFMKLNPTDQNAICKSGNGVFRVDYGFDGRKKDWNFTQAISAPPCDCESSCSAGYNLDISTNPGHPRCTRKLSNTSGIPDQVSGSHNNGFGVLQNEIYHYKPVTQGACTLPWSNRLSNPVKLSNPIKR